MLDPKKLYQESAEAFMRVEVLLGLRDAILVAITTMERLRIRLLGLGWAPLMLKLRESLSFSVEFIRIDKSTNFDTSDNMSVDLSLRSKLFGKLQKKREYSASSWWRGNQVLKSGYSFDGDSSVVALLIDNKSL